MAVLLLLVFACYWPGLGGGFVFDDFPNIVDNTAVHVDFASGWHAWMGAAFSSPSSELQRPLAMASFALNHALTGLDPYWMKLTNVGIHILNTCLVYALMLQLLRLVARRGRMDAAIDRRPVALWVAGAWALNPINLLAVLLVVQRMESLCHTFVFGGLWLYLLGRERLLAGRSGWPLLLGGLVGGTVLGMLAKESAALLPLYAFLIEWILLDFAGIGRRDRGLMLVFALVLVVPGAVGVAWQLPAVLKPGAWAWRSFDLGERLLTEPRALVDYLHWTVLPSLGQLGLYHDDIAVSHGLFDPPTTLAALLAVAALLAAAVWLRARRPLMSLGIAWFFAAQLLTATVIPLELVYEHRNYFASLGLCMALADALFLLPTTSARRRIGRLVALALLLLYAGTTTLRAIEWSSPLRLSMSEAARHPLSPRASYGYARDLIIQSNYRLDSPYLAPAFAAIEHAMTLPDGSPLPEQAAIELASRTGRPIPDAWWERFAAKLRSRPIGPQETSALDSLVRCQIARLCRLPDARMQASFAGALARGPNPEVLNIQGNYVLNIRHDSTRALRLWEQAARLAPGVVQYQVTLARMQMATGQWDSSAATIAHIRAMGRWGQNNHAADLLQQLLAQYADAPAQRDAQPQ